MGFSLEAAHRALQQAGDLEAAAILLLDGNAILESSVRDTAAELERDQINREIREMLREHAASFITRNGPTDLTYEAWIAHLHPENVTLDARLKTEGCEHQKIWQEALTTARSRQAQEDVMRPMRDMMSMMNPMNAMQAMMCPMHTMTSMKDSFASATIGAASLAGGQRCDGGRGEAKAAVVRPMRDMMSMMQPMNAMQATLHPMHTMTSMKDSFASATIGAATLAGGCRQQHRRRHHPWNGNWHGHRTVLAGW